MIIKVCLFLIPFGDLSLARYLAPSEAGHFLKSLLFIVNLILKVRFLTIGVNEDDS